MLQHNRRVQEHVGTLRVRSGAVLGRTGLSFGASRFACRDIASTTPRLRLSPAPENGVPRRYVRATTTEEGGEKAGTK